MGSPDFSDADYPKFDMRHVISDVIGKRIISVIPVTKVSSGDRIRIQINLDDGTGIQITSATETALTIARIDPSNRLTAGD